MSRKNTVICLGVAALVVAIIGEANADHHSRFSTTGSHPALRTERREILNKRFELRNDLRDLHRKQVELRRDLRRGAPAAQIARDRAETRRDLREIARQRQALRQQYRDFYRDRRGFGWYRHPDGRWYRYPPYRYGWRR